MTGDAKFQELVQRAGFADNMLKNQLSRFLPQPNGTWTRAYSTMSRSSLHVFTTAGLKLENIACHADSAKLAACKTLGDIAKKVGSGISGEITVTLTDAQYKTANDYYQSIITEARSASRST